MHEEGGRDERWQRATIVRSDVDVGGVDVEPRRFGWQGDATGADGLSAERTKVGGS